MPPKPTALTKPPAPKRPHDPARADPGWDQIRERAAIDDHVAAARDLLGRHRFDRRAQPEIHAALARFEEHERERRLFLGVVGEFSSGKSTLLNALLRDDLLRADVLQGTTAAATLLSYGQELTVKVIPLPSNRVVQIAKLVWRVLSLPAWMFRPGQPRNREGLRELIHASTAVEEASKNVAQVNVTHPAKCLRDGMVIVDLPGTNASNPRHGGVTAAALTELCDAAVVVVPADAPGSETLWGFLKNHIDIEVLRRCVFVLNKIDLIRRPADRAQLTSNLAARLKRDLGIDSPKVVTAAPERILEAAGLLSAAIDPDLAMSDGEKVRWVAEFEKTEDALWAILRQQKLLLLVERLARLLAEVFDRLTSALQTRDAEYKERHAALLYGLEQIPDLAAFVAEARRKHCGAFLGSLREIAGACGSALGEVRAATLRVLAKIIFSTESRQELQSALEGAVPRVLDASQEDARGVLRSCVATYEAIAEEEHKEFHEGFQALYRNLATLGGKVRADRLGLGQLGGGHLSRDGEPAALAEGVAQLRKADLWKAAGGAGAGAFIGSMMLPGVGTLVGGLLGGLFSMIFGPSHAQIQQECWERLESSVLRSFDCFLDQAIDHLQSSSTQIHDRLAEAIGQYADKYRRLVNEMIQRDQAEAEALATYRKQVERDLASLGDRSRRLSQSRDQLRSL